MRHVPIFIFPDSKTVMEGTEEKSNTPAKETDRDISLDGQLEHLSKEFKGQCKVLSGSGRFSKTVKLNPENYDLVINFKLTGKFNSIYISTCMG